MAAGSGTVRSLLRNRTFLLLQARGTAAGVGYTVYLGTILWLTYQLTGGILLAGIVVGAETAVYALTFLTGPLVDGVRDKRSVYLVCYPIQALTALALGVTYAFGILTVPLLLVFVVILAVLWDFTWAADAATTRLLFDKDQLFALSGLGTAIGGGVDIALYFVTGVTIALLGAAGGSYLYALLLGAGALLAIPLSIPTPNAPKGSYRTGFGEGWALFRGDGGKALRHIAILQAVYGFFTVAPLLLLTLYVGRFFSGSQPTYAGLYVAYLVGGIVMGITLGRLNPRRFVGPIATISLLATGVLLLATEWAAGSVLLSLVAWFMVGVVVTSRYTAFSTYLQGKFAPEILARIAGNNYVFTGVSAAAGAFIIGALSTSWSPEMLTDLVAAGFLGSAALAYVLSGTRTLAY